MKPKISEINITPVKPRDGLVGFVNLLLDDWLYVGSIAIYTRPNGNYRLVYPTKKLGEKNVHIFHPISRSQSEYLEKEVSNHFTRLFEK